MNKILFNNKAIILKELRYLLKKSIILDQEIIEYSEWKRNTSEVFKRVKKKFKNKKLIVRSSHYTEDREGRTNAGKFLSIKNLKNKSDIVESISKVFHSYKKIRESDIVFIQEYINDSLMSGVVFNSEPNSQAPYYLINYSLGNDTSIVTSGKLNNQMLIIHKSYEYNDKKEFKKVINAIKEIESIFPGVNLDVEFALSKMNEVIIFQVRFLTKEKLNCDNDQKHKKEISKLEKYFTRISKKQPYIIGDKFILGSMPDWNPAEIIGLRPRPLSLSIYKEMITDRIWAYQRDNYGYRNLRSAPLMYSIGGIPFIDVRASFNSFVPKDLSKKLSHKIVNFYLNKLTNNKILHDKVEFEVVLSCYVPNIKTKIEELKKNGFQDDELSELKISLRNLTNQIIDFDKGFWRDDLRKIEVLKLRQNKLESFRTDYLNKIYWYTEDCKRYGTLPFAGLARVGFIAQQILNSLVDENLLTPNRYKQFNESLETVNYELQSDLIRLNKTDFLKKYGHLRPGTYDILSKRYDESPELYFSWNSNKKILKKNPFVLTLKESKKIQILLDINQINHTSESLFKFMKAAIEGREYSKFVFTKSISKILSLLIKYGEKLGFTREELSYVNFQKFLGSFSYSSDIKKLLKELIALGEKEYSFTKSIMLPNLIFEKENFYFFSLDDSSPNFITNKKVKGSLENIEVQKNFKKLKKKIILIENADPGFDWLFDKKIAAFITCYGGPNSHMAVRAMELSIPAIIGVGEKIFSSLKKQKYIEFDCLQKQITHTS